MRLNKYLAETLGLSRREADDLIAAGKVKINGTPATLGARLPDEPDATLEVDGRPLRVEPKSYTYLMLNKPVGYVCSRKQQGENPTLYDLLPEKYHPLKTVGRLDKNSSGLILLTDDGDFAFKMTHPKFYKTKTYVVTLNKPLQPLHQQMISDFGIVLEDGPSRLILTTLDTERLKFQVEMHEGRNRQIRRTFRALGYEVKTLHRTAFGAFTLGDLPTGKFKELVIK